MAASGLDGRHFNTALTITATQLECDLLGLDLVALKAHRPTQQRCLYIVDIVSIAAFFYSNAKTHDPINPTLYTIMCHTQYLTQRSVSAIELLARTLG